MIVGTKVKLTNLPKPDYAPDVGKSWDKYRGKDGVVVGRVSNFLRVVLDDATFDSRTPDDNTVLVKESEVTVTAHAGEESGS